MLGICQKKISQAPQWLGKHTVGANPEGAHVVPYCKLFELKIIAANRLSGLNA